MAEKVAGSLSSIITFFGVFEVLIFSNLWKKACVL
jgi:hypothetical protein